MLISLYVDSYSTLLLLIL